MRIASLLVEVAALLVAAGCGGGVAGPLQEADGGSDAGPDAPIGCGGCGCGGGDAGPTTHDVTAAQACELLAENFGNVGNPTYGPSCSRLCAGPAYFCELPDAFVQEVQALNPDAGAAPADGGPLNLSCPTTASTQTVTCIVNCTGRLTEGFGAPSLGSLAAEGDGERLAAMAYLEAVSVHAFARLERELTMLGATPALIREARRARRDEVRHTAMTTRLARARGGSPRVPVAPRVGAARSLFEVTLENAVEGCVRETYGAVTGLVEAQTSADASLRRAMRSIADDECRHAELAWAVHAWAMPRLSASERRQVNKAMRAAIAEIELRDAHAASSLFDVGGDDDSDVRVGVASA